MEKLTTPIALVDVTAFKRAVHLQENETGEDAKIASLLDVAMGVVDTATASPMVAADFRFTLPAADYGCWWFPLRPVISLTGIETKSGNADWVEADLASATLLCAYDEPHLSLSDDLRAAICAADEVRVVASVGGDLKVQQNQAVILMVQEWRLAGIALEAVEAHDLSFAVHSLIRQVRYRRPQVIG